MATIMILEDQPLVAQDLHTFLTTLGYSVLPPFSSVESAMRMSLDSPPDVIILDMQFSGELSGRDLHRKLTAQRRVPVIHLTSESRFETWDQELDVEPFAVLFKPVQPRQLDTVLKRLEELTHLQQKLRENEQVFRRIVNSLPQFVTYTDHDLVYRFVNDTYLRESGLAPGSVIGRRVRDMLDPVSYEKMLPRIRTVLSGIPVRYQDTLRYPDGTARHIDGHLIPNTGQDGSVTGYYAVLHDVTLYRETENALMERLKIETLFSSVASDCLHSSREELDETVIESLERLGGFTGAERSYLASFRSSPDAQVTVSHDWSRPDRIVPVREIRSVRSRELPWFYARMRLGEPILFSDPEELPPEAELERRLMEAMSVQSCAVVPLFSQGEFNGLIAVETIHERRRWNESDIMVLSTIGALLVQALGNRSITEHNH